MIPQKLRHVFKDYKDYPILENIRPKMDYIDNIHPKQMESSLMKGTDGFNRPFIAIKLFPRDLYEKMLKQHHKNHESCLTLVALSRTKYLPPDIARHIHTFMEYHPSASSCGYDSDDEMTNSFRRRRRRGDTLLADVRRARPYPRRHARLLPPKKFLQNQISVHTIFQRYTISGLDKSPFVHAENSRHCLARYRWKMLDINTLVLLSNGEWNYENGINDPESELTKLLQGSHPKSMLFNEKIEQLINGILS